MPVTGRLGHLHRRDRHDHRRAGRHHHAVPDLRRAAPGALFDLDAFTFDHRRPVRRHGGVPVKGLAGKCLDVRNGATRRRHADPALHLQRPAAQTWTVDRRTARCKALGKCLDVTGGGTADGTKIQLWTCNGRRAQNWAAQADGTLRNPQSGKCLDVSGNNSADGTVVQLWTCTRRRQPEVDPALTGRTAPGAPRAPGTPP